MTLSLHTTEAGQMTKTKGDMASLDHAPRAGFALESASRVITDAAAIAAELQRRLEPARRNPRDRSGWSGSEDYYLAHIPQVWAVDGLCVSVQTSSTHYCTPRDWRGPWSSVEVGYPSRRVEALMPYIDGGDGAPTDTVYGYVPLSTVAQIIADAGGLQPEVRPAQ